MDQGRTGMYSDGPRKKPVWPLILLMGLLIFLFAGLSAFLWFNPQIEKTTDDSVTVSTPRQPHENDAFLRKLSLDLDRQFGISSQINSDAVSIPGPIVKVEGYDFSVPIQSTRDVSTLWTVVDNERLQPALDSVAEFMKGEGLSAIQTQEIVPIHGERYLNYTYIGDNLACSAARSDDGPAVNGDVKGIKIGCADTDNYKNISEQTKPFYELFVNSAYPDGVDKQKNIVMNINTDNALPSKSSGYMTLSGIVSGEGEKNGSVSFYQTPDEQWHFFQIVHSVVECKLYDTDEQKRAYEGRQCIDNENRKFSQVKL